MKPDLIEALYTNRFSEKEISVKNRIWSILCRSFFNRYSSDDARVVDIGAGYCEFLNNITAADKVAIDINPDTPRFAAPGVRVIADDCRNIASIGTESVDLVFTSNFLEHLRDKDDVAQTLRESFRILRREGRIILMGPNIRFLADCYWDFFDHRIPLSDRSLREVLLAIGFSIETVHSRFLPYTTKSRVPKFKQLIRLYLACPLLHRFFGTQFLIIGRKP